MRRFAISIAALSLVIGSLAAARTRGVRRPPEVAGTAFAHRSTSSRRTSSRSEVNPVIRMLRSGRIAVTALHGHMLEE